MARPALRRTTQSLTTAFSFISFSRFFGADQVMEDWRFVAMVLDRFFLWVFTVACVAGMAVIILQAPSLYDTTHPIDIKFSKIAQKKLKYMAKNAAFT